MNLDLALREETVPEGGSSEMETFRDRADDAL